MRKVVKDLIEMMKREGFSIPSDRESSLAIYIEITGCYDSIEETIGQLINAEDDEERTEANRSVFNLQRRLGTKQ